MTLRRLTRTRRSSPTMAEKLTPVTTSLSLIMLHFLRSKGQSTRHNYQIATIGLHQHSTTRPRPESYSDRQGNHKLYPPHPHPTQIMYPTPHPHNPVATACKRNLTACM